MGLVMTIVRLRLRKERRVWGRQEMVCRYQHPWEKAAFRARRVWHTCMDKEGTLFEEEIDLIAFQRWCFLGLLQ